MSKPSKPINPIEYFTKFSEENKAQVDALIKAISEQNLVGITSAVKELQKTCTNSEIADFLNADAGDKKTIGLGIIKKIGAGDNDKSTGVLLALMSYGANYRELDFAQRLGKSTIPSNILVKFTDASKRGEVFLSGKDSRNSAAVKKNPPKVAEEVYGFGALPEGDPEEVFGFRTVLELAEKLTKMEIPSDSNLAATLKKIPTLEDLESDAANNKNSAAEILNKFKKYYTDSVKETGITKVDEAIKDAFYLRFISQEMAERTASGEGFDPESLEGLEKFSLKDWQNVCKILGQKGNNISISGVFGKRPQGKFGALAGGLSDVIPFALYEAIKDALESGTLTPKQQNELTLSLQRADNVTFDEAGNTQFLHASNRDQELEIKINTAARETTEEFAELVIAQYLFLQKSDVTKKLLLSDLYKDVFGVKNLSTEAEAIFNLQQQALDPISRNVDFEDKAQRDQYRKQYKTEVEPFFARFLKETKEGNNIHQDISTAIRASNKGSLVNDLTYPSDRLAAFSLRGSMGFIEPGRIDVMIPVSTSFSIEVVKGSRFDSFVKGTIKLAEKIDQLKPYCVEARGFEVIEDPAKRAAYLLKIFSEGKAGYPHEGLEAVRLALSDCKKAGIDANQIVAELKTFGVDLNQYTQREAFKLGLNLQLSKLVDFQMRDLGNPNLVLSDVSKVASKMFAEYAGNIKLDVFGGIPSKDASMDDKMTFLTQFKEPSSFGDLIKMTREEVKKIRDLITPVTKMTKDLHVDRIPNIAQTLKVDLPTLTSFGGILSRIDLALNLHDISKEHEGDQKEQSEKKLSEILTIYSGSFDLENILENSNLFQGVNFESLNSSKPNNEVRPQTGPQTLVTEPTSQGRDK